MIVIPFKNKLSARQKGKMNKPQSFKLYAAFFMPFIQFFVSLLKEPYEQKIT